MPRLNWNYPPQKPFLNEGGFTSLCYLADVVISVPEKALEILSLDYLQSKDSAFHATILAMKDAIKKNDGKSIEKIAQQLINSSSRADKNAGDALFWAIAARKKPLDMGVNNGWR